MWASSYELYDRLSPPYQKFFESLTGFYDSPGLRNAGGNNPNVYKGERGAPENVGLEFSNSHVSCSDDVLRWPNISLLFFSKSN